MNQLVETLREFGLSSYEASAYAALVAIGEATAKEVSSKAGIPRTKVYEVLNRLVEKGFAEVQPGNPAIFRAVEPAKIAARMQRDFNERLSRMLKAFEEVRMQERGESRLVWISRGKWAVENRLREFLRDGEKVMVFCITDTFAGVLSEVRGEHRVLLYEKFRVPDNIREFRVLDLEKIKNAADSFVAKFAEIFEGKEGKPEMLAISERGSILALLQGGEYLALSIHLPLIVALQRKMFDTLYESYCQGKI
ncbi:MAG: TrmB family transcriptional regulator [Archaeoglobaceae archaeon]